MSYEIFFEDADAPEEKRFDLNDREKSERIKLCQGDIKDRSQFKSSLFANQLILAISSNDQT